MSQLFSGSEDTIFRIARDHRKKLKQSSLSIVSSAFITRVTFTICTRYQGEKKSFQKSRELIFIMFYLKIQSMSTRLWANNSYHGHPIYGKMMNSHRFLSARSHLINEIKTHIAILSTKRLYAYLQVDCILIDHEMYITSYM